MSRASIDSPELAEAYGGVAKALHWLIAALLCVQYAIAYFMPHIGRNTPNTGLVNLHLSFGALIFLIVVARWIWRLTHPVPLMRELAPWQRRLSWLTHLSIYAVLLIMPLMGWANAGFRGYDVSLFNVVPLPALVAKGSALGRELGDVHVFVAWYFLAVIGLHIVAALYHRFVRRDAVMARMLPLR